MKRPYGAAHIYEKWDSYYGRWRTADGRHLNRRIGPKRSKGGSDGLTRPEAERAFRRIQAEEATRNRSSPSWRSSPSTRSQTGCGSGS